MSHVFSTDRQTSFQLLLRALDLSEAEFATERSAIELDPKGWLRRRIFSIKLAGGAE